MKRPFLLSLAVAFSLSCLGQEFTQKALMELPDSLTFQDLELTDIDNDSLLDVILFSETADGAGVVSFLRNNGLEGVQHVTHLNAELNEVSHYLTDLDGDNQIDIILSGQSDDGPVMTVFLNRSNFSFERRPLANFSGTLFQMADFDSDGIREMLVTGKSGVIPFLRILRDTPGGWEIVHDSIAVHASAIESFDFDSDNDIDFFISGLDESGNPVAQIFYNQGRIYFTEESLQPFNGVSACSDVNHDGLFDIQLSGKNAVGDCMLRTILNSGSGFHVTDSVMEACASRMTSADFDSDGAVDLQFFALHSGNDTINIISRKSVIDTVMYKNVRQQAVGDFDRDGDLDLAQVTEHMGVSSVVIVLNETGKNRAPRPPLLPISARIFNRIFLSWDSSTDDHTPIESVTYDVSIQVADDNLVPAGFDLINGNRLLVSHGNNLSQRYALIRNAESGPFFFMVQSVDNSFHAGRGGVCNSSGGGGCLEMETTAIDACSNEVVILQAESSAEWFSFREGFLAEATSLSFLVESSDTLFSVEPQGADCARISVYTIQMKHGLEKMIESTRFVCEGESLRMGVEPGWASTEWSSSLKGFLSAEDSVEYIFAVPDTLQVVVADGGGCEITRKTILNLSKPDIEVTPEAYQIMKGESVRLNATGGNTFEWRPATGLDDPYSPTPLATPDRTTEYVVVVRDSLGCEATGGITVIVEETAFIPNLFTPNNDGSNDVLKIYGLGSAREFSFTIYNREGVRVYQTSNISDAVSMGWNGTSRGVDLPAGVYFWKVSGQTDSGKSLLLNGKHSGSIVLLR